MTTPAHTPHDDDQVIDSLRAQQQRETSQMGVGSPAQVRGAWMGAVVGAAIGAVLGLVAALVLIDDAARWVLVVIAAAFGAVAGAVYEAGRNPEREGELQRADGGPDESTAVGSNPGEDRQEPPR